MADFTPAATTLRQKRQAVERLYREALQDLAGVLEEASALLA